MNLKWKHVITAIVIGILFSSLFGIALMAQERYVQFEGTPDGWLSYWGGILGSSIGVFGSLFILREQIKVEKMDNTFFNLLTIHNEIINEIRLSGEGRKNTFDVIYLSMTNNDEKQYNKNVDEKRCELLVNNKNNIIDCISLIKKDISELILTHDEVSSPHEISSLYLLQSYLKHSESELKDDLEKKNFENVLKYLKNLIMSISDTGKFSSDSDIPNVNFYKLKKLYYDIDYMDYPELTREQKKAVVESVLNKYYNDIGNYFRIFHRIIKFVNENVQDEKSKANYIGFLRAMLNEKEMLVIYYNAFYSERGKGLGEQLELINFYGGVDDIPIEGNKDAQHFNKSSLLWEKDDIKKMRSFKAQRTSNRKTRQKKQ